MKIPLLQNMTIRALKKTVCVNTVLLFISRPMSSTLLLHENEKLKAEVKQLKEAANREVLLGRGGFSNSSSAMSGPTSGIISRRKTSQAMVLEEEGDEDDSDEDEKDSR